MDSNGQTLHDKPHTCMLCGIYGNAMLYFYYVIVTFFFHGGKMCRIFSIPWGGTIYGTIFHPVGWKMFRHIFHPGWTKVVLCRIFSIQWGGKCAGFFPSSGSDGECNGEIDGEKKIHPTATCNAVAPSSSLALMLAPASIKRRHNSILCSETHWHRQADLWSAGLPSTSRALTSAPF